MKKLLLLVLGAFSFGAQAQKIFLKSGELLPVNNVGRIDNFALWNAQEYGNMTYCIAQFTKSTSQNERIKISQETGIQFFDYIPRWAFIAAIPPI
ncbi:MAG: hypothetical protein IPK62_06050 [Bacteroidetes bacterium]|nr:hypothetical protein [Bacteroidota bacterium]